MNKIIHYIGLDVHKETIAVSIAPEHATEVRRYGITGGKIISVKTRDVKSRTAMALRLAAQSLWRSKDYLGECFRR